MALPSQTTLGIRQRFSSMLTWETDLKWTSADLRLPSFATAVTPNGTVSAPSELPTGKGYLGLRASVEVELSKDWTVRGGLAFDQRSVEEAAFEPLVGGSRTSAFSIGAGYRVWGGEVNLGYQFRQSEDLDARQGDGVWDWQGYRNTGSRVRMEGMGHLMAIGFKKTF